jgi:hypothetical protein
MSRSGTTRRRITGWLLWAIPLSVAFAPRPLTAAAQEISVCNVPIQAQVYNGPHAGLVLSGSLQLVIEASGSTNGLLQTEQGETLAATGQTTGRMLGLLLNLPDGTHVSAVGTADADLQTCQFSIIFGPLVGPAADDSGSWTGVAPSA